MAETIRVGIAGMGWPGEAHARGYAQAGGFKLVAVADPIPQRREALAKEQPGVRAVADAKELVKDPQIDLLSICLPNAMHAELAIAAMRAGKHVIIETPPALSVRQARQIQTASAKYSRQCMYAFQRRFGGAELAARQAIDKGYAGEIYHARASWLRTRGIPQGTGWFTRRDQSGGGALLDLGIHMLDLAWHLMGAPRPINVFAATHRRLGAPESDVEDAATALFRFDGGKTLELAAAWALNQPPQQQGIACRLFGDRGAVDCYTPAGAQLHRHFSAKGESKAVALKPPQVTGHAAMMRAMKQAIRTGASAGPGRDEGVALMQMIEAAYRSADSGRSVEIKTAMEPAGEPETAES